MSDCTLLLSYNLIVQIYWYSIPSESADLTNHILKNARLELSILGFHSKRQQMGLEISVEARDETTFLYPGMYHRPGATKRK